MSSSKLGKSKAPYKQTKFHLAVDKFVRQYLLKLLLAHDGDVRKAAKSDKITSARLYDLLIKYEIDHRAVKLGEAVGPIRRHEIDHQALNQTARELRHQKMKQFHQWFRSAIDNPLTYRDKHG